MRFENYTKHTFQSQNKAGTIYWVKRSSEKLFGCETPQIDMWWIMDAILFDIQLRKVEAIFVSS